MIRKIEYITGKDGNGNVYGAIPSDAEVIAKINEVIDHLNRIRFIRKPNNEIACKIDEKLIDEEW